MARRRPPEPNSTPPPALGLRWHPALAVGRNIETWCPDLAEMDDEDRMVKSWTRHRNAVRAWKSLTEDVWSQHPDLLPRWARGSLGRPWSYRFLRERRPDRLAQLLHDRGLPADWSPTPAPRPLRELMPYGPPSPTAVALLIGESL